MTRPPIQTPPRDAEPLTPTEMIVLVRNASGHFSADEDYFYQIATLLEAIAGADDIELVHRLAQMGIDLAQTVAGDCEEIAAIYASEADRAERATTH